jgi:hypothetical protein
MESKAVLLLMRLRPLEVADFLRLLGLLSMCPFFSMCPLFSMWLRGTDLSLWCFLALSMRLSCFLLLAFFRFFFGFARWASEVGCSWGLMSIAY